MIEVRNSFTVGETWQWQLILLAAVLMPVIYRVCNCHAKNHVSPFGFNYWLECHKQTAD